jgi:hypothetical protein
MSYSAHWPGFANPEQSVIFAGIARMSLLDSIMDPHNLVYSKVFCSRVRVVVRASSTDEHAGTANCLYHKLAIRWIGAQQFE